MPQSPAPGRLLVCLVTSLAVASAAGCMSVGDDGGKPVPSSSAGRHGTVVAPDGGTGEAPGVAGAGQGRGGKGDVPHKRGRDGKANGASPSASSSTGAPSPVSTKGVRPQPGRPARPRPEPPVRTEDPTRPAPPPSDPPAPPPSPDPEPQPNPDPEPTVLPSASPAAHVRLGTPGMPVGDGMGMRKEPSASPQMGPV